MDILEFDLLINNKEHLNLETSTAAKVSAQGIQQDQFRRIWSSVQEVMNFRRLKKFLEK